MALPTAMAGTIGNRFNGPQKRVASANIGPLSGPSAKKQRLNALLEKAEPYHKFVNESSRFRQSPLYIKGQLRDYQVQALNWLISLYENKIGGILADEMGLGKTVQSIAVLGYLKYFKYINGPFLVIGMKSVISSWMHEFKKFCPTMIVVELAGDKHSRATQISNMEKNVTNWDVCVTTFEMILHEPFFRRHQWDYVVIDEGHRLKNEKSVFCKLIREVHSKNRLLLTGTPLQNNLHELWAMLNYLMPDIFNETEIFDCDDDEESMKCVRAILQPFFLRRVKADVETSLLPKIEYKLFVGLTKLQRDNYINATEKSKNISSQTNKFHSLRKIANHPYLIRGVEPGPPYKDHGEHLINTSGKMILLDKLLRALKLGGSRVLLFSQGVEMLDIIEDYLDWRKYIYRRLDGQTSYTKRADDIKAFNAPKSNIFIYILSTHAGALGINLQTADTVILFDSDLNPLTDLQAVDRAHRIGQTKQVRVYRLISENTVDECIVARADVKLHLNNMMIERGRVFENSTVSGSVKNKLLDFGVAAIKDISGITDVDVGTLFRYSKRKTAEIASKLKKMSENELRSAGFEGTPVTTARPNWSLANLNCFRMSHSQQNYVASSSASPIGNSQNLSNSRTIPPATNFNQFNIRVAQFALDKSASQITKSDNVVLPTTSAETKAAPSTSVHFTVQPTAAAAKIETTAPPSTSVNFIVQPSAATAKTETTALPRSVQLELQPTATAETTVPPSASVHFSVRATATTGTTTLPSTSSYVHLNVYQFYPVQLIEKCSGNRMLNLSTETELKKILLAQGFPDWSWNDYKTFCDAVRKYGRFDLSSVAQVMMPLKNYDEVVKYHEQFFSRGPSESAEINSILSRIIFEEKVNQQRDETFKWKMSQPGGMVIQPIDNRLRNEKFTAGHDKYLVSAISRYGLAFNVCGRIIADIRFHSDFGFFTTFQFGMMTEEEIKDRINHLVSSVQHEYLAAFTEVTVDDDKKMDLEPLPV